MLLAFLAPCQVRLHAHCPPTTRHGSSVRKDEEQIRLYGLLSSWQPLRTLCAVWKEPIAGALSSRRSAASTPWKAGAGCKSCRRAVSSRSYLLVRSDALPRLARDRDRGTRAH